MTDLLGFIQDIAHDARHYQTIIAAFIGGGIALKYNKSKHILDKENTKRQLFTQLNEKYDSLNDHLETLVHIEFETERDAKINGDKNLDLVWDELFESEPTKQSKTITAAFDYINLCSEQYYWYKKGFIDENVWSCWKKGMQDWAKHSFFISKIIERERTRKASYYNDDFLDIFA